jgi:hypothetical protein
MMLMTMTMTRFSILHKAAVALLLVVVSLCEAFTQQQLKQQQQQPSQKHAQLTQLDLQLSMRSSTHLHTSSSKNSKPCRCPDDYDYNGEDEDSEEDVLEDRREALFAMMGSLWAVGALPNALLQMPQPANALYGSDAKMNFPDVVQGLSDRNSKQCLVESLGNRECLVYREDEEKLLYKGADVQVLLERIQSAAAALETEIPTYVERKEWSKITGVLTGPMGQLSSTLTMLSKLAEDPSEAKQNAQTVKNNLFAMGTATTNKEGCQVLKYQEQAVQDLAVFLKSL